jgi:predicted metal-dependent HD superfamily phosphohydrolase
MNLAELLEKYKIKADIKMLLDMWNEPHRYYHNTFHLVDIHNQILNDFINNKLNEKTTEKLLITNLFHDIVYNTDKNDNEEKSANFFLSLCVEKNDTHIIDIKQAILDTKTHNDDNYLSKLFNKYDMSIIESNYDKLLEWEAGIYEEYKIYGDKYKQGRLQFLESIIDKYPLNSGNLSKLIEFVKTNY